MSGECEYFGLNTGIISHEDGVKKICKCCRRLISTRWINPNGFCADCHFNCQDLREEYVKRSDETDGEE